MPTFDMVVVGAGGGPDETNLSAYLIKPCGATWEDGIVALEAGSGQGALNQLLLRDPHLFAPRRDDHVPNNSYSASDVYSFVRCFLITHAHLDHINSLVISAGSFRGPRKRIYAAKPALVDLQGIFSDRIWPNLASWNEDDENYKLLYTTLRVDNNYQTIYPGVSVRAIAINHGRNEAGIYQSTAFFIRHNPSAHEFLFFGDVEPDTLAAKPRTIIVWRAAAPKIPETLSTIFIECSWPLGRQDDMLYGHLNPEHLVAELVSLATEVVKARSNRQTDSRSRPARKKPKKNPISMEDLRGALDGVRVFVTHCKDSFENVTQEPVRHIIVQQVRNLVEEKGLGVEVLAAEQGMRIEI